MDLVGREGRLMKATDWLNRLKQFLVTIRFLQDKKEAGTEFRSSESDREETINLIWKAHRDWVQAYCFFDITADEDLIDYSIQNLGAAESRYQYLLKRARLNKVRVFDPEQLREVDAHDSLC
jgi:hypothetical protein